jgi:hypothetical protein
LCPRARLFFEKLLAAKFVDLPFEEFREDMECEEETKVYFAWRRAVLKRPQ